MKKKVLKTLSLILTAFIAATMIPFASFAAETVYEVSTAEELTAVGSEINNIGAGDYIIAFTDDINGNGISFTKEGINVTVLGNGHTLTCPSSAFQVWNGASLTLGDGISSLTIKGGNDNDNPGIIYINGEQSICNMNDKVTLKDHTGSNYFGGGVTVEGGTFNMYGGTIENCGINGGSVCYGGGVAVYNNGTFNMSGGTIKDCYATTTYNASSWQTPSNAGGGVFVSGSTFNMTGGTIQNCTATTDGGGIAIITSLESVYDAGNYGYLDSKFTMSGGTVTGCEAGLVGGGIFAGGAYVEYHAIGAPTPAASGNMADPGIYISDGTISDNEATAGGGIFLNWIRPSIPVQIHNALITDNTAGDGAGIEVMSYWTQADIDGCTITGNTAENGSGGGIALIGNSSGNGTTLKNTTITNNTSTDRGAGVYYDGNSKLTISGADVIKNNKYNGQDNNLNVLSLANPVYVGGALTGSEIGLSDPTLWDDGLGDDDATAVSTNSLTSGYKTYNADAPETFFTSDHTTWSADFSDVNTDEVRLVRLPHEYLTEFEVDKSYFGMTGYDNEDDPVTTAGTLAEDVLFTIAPYNSFNREIGKTQIPAFNPTTFTISVGDGTDNTTVALPDFTSAAYGIGDYWYKVTETAGNTAGVTYDNAEYYLHLVVTCDDPVDPSRCGVSQVTLHKSAPDNDGTFVNNEADKTTGFSNEFGAGSLTVRKTVTGNMSDKEKPFDVNVTFTAPAGKTVTGDITYGMNKIDGGWTGSRTVTLTLTDGASVTFENIPAGVTYTISEADYSADGYDNPAYSFDNASETGDTTASGETWAANSAAGVITDSADTVTVTNNKTATIDVGVFLENAPFIILFVTSLAIAAVLVFRRKKPIERD